MPTPVAASLFIVRRSSAGHAQMRAADDGTARNAGRLVVTSGTPTARVLRAIANFSNLAVR